MSKVQIARAIESMPRAFDTQAKQSEKAKIVAIDDDPMFAAVLSRAARLEGVKIDTFLSLEELGFVGLLARYDVLIVDYDLGTMSGKDLALYISNLFMNKPLVMISSSDRSQELLNCPDCVQAFLKKSVGYEKILKTALEIQKKSRQ